MLSNVVYLAFTTRNKASSVSLMWVQKLRQQLAETSLASWQSLCAVPCQRLASSACWLHPSPTGGARLAMLRASFQRGGVHGLEGGTGGPSSWGTVHCLPSGCSQSVWPRQWHGQVLPCGARGIRGSRLGHLPLADLGVRVAFSGAVSTKKGLYWHL